MAEGFVRQFCKYCILLISDTTGLLCGSEWDRYCLDQPVLTAATELLVIQNRFLSYAFKLCKIGNHYNGFLADFRIQILAK